MVTPGFTADGWPAQSILSAPTPLRAFIISQLTRRKEEGAQKTTQVFSQDHHSIILEQRQNWRTDPCIKIKVKRRHCKLIRREEHVAFRWLAGYFGTERADQFGSCHINLAFILAEKSKMCKKSDRNSKLQYNGMEKGVSTIYFKNLKNSSLCKSNSTGKSHKYNKVIIFNVLVNS